jgi:predicted nucleic acid-binding protein
MICIDTTVLIDDALGILRKRKIAPASLAIAEQCGRAAARLRQSDRLSGRSSNDIWIAATALSFGARLMTRNVAHFEGIERLELIRY